MFLHKKFERGLKARNNFRTPIQDLLHAESSSSSQAVPGGTRTSKQMTIALRVASNPALLNAAREVFTVQSSSSVNSSRIKKYVRIVRAAGFDPWPVSATKIEVFLAAGISAGYATLDDDISAVIGADSAISPAERSVISSMVATVRRKGYFEHSQKDPVFLRDILPIGDRVDRASLLVAFYFGLRKREVLEVGKSIKVGWSANSIALDFRGTVLKSNKVSGTRIRCSCDHGSSFPCLHGHKAEINGGLRDPGDVIRRCIPLASGKSAHSCRIGCLMSLLGQNISDLALQVHLRWVSPGMVAYYARRRGSHEVPECPVFIM